MYDVIDFIRFPFKEYGGILYLQPNLNVFVLTRRFGLFYMCLFKTSSRNSHGEIYRNMLPDINVVLC